MKKFNRSTVLTIAAQAVQSSFNNVLIRSISLAQLALHGQVTDAERLQIVGLSAKPDVSDAVNYAKFNYAGKLIKAAEQCLNTTIEFQTSLKAVDVSDAKSMENFQVVQALKGCFITDQNSWNKAVTLNLTADAKLAIEAAKQAKDAAKPSKVTTQTTETATAKGTDSATLEAGQAAQEQADTVSLAMAALAEALTVKDGIGQLLATLSHVDPAVALVEVVNYHRAEMARMTLELEAAKAPAKNPQRQQKAA